MRRITLFILVSFSLILSISAQEKDPGKLGDVQTVDYCSLRENPDLYNGKTIRVSGIYARGFEMSAFFSNACIEDIYRSRHETWVRDFYQARTGLDRQTSAIVSTFLDGDAGDDLEVTLIGIFRGTKTGGTFGHLGGWRFQIEVSNIEKAKLFPEEVSGCRRIDPTKPFHFLSLENVEEGIPPRYEKSEKPKREKLIYLRLGNNSTCPIRVPTMEYSDNGELQDRSQVSVAYDLVSPCVRVAGISMPEKRTLSVLTPGKSIYFAVPLRLLTKEPYELRIPFDSGRVKDLSYYRPFYFSRYDVTKELQKNLDCTKY